MAYMIGAFAIGLAATLALAGFLTPASWWRRPNLKALAVLAAGTWGVGSLLLSFAPAPAMATSVHRTATVLSEVQAPGRSFRVFEALNLRASSGTGARRVAVVPAGAQVTTTGAREGDWWEVSGTVAGKPVTGWVSSLWLRRADEPERPRAGRATPSP